MEIFAREKVDNDLTRGRKEKLRGGLPRSF